MAFIHVSSCAKDARVRRPAASSITCAFRGLQLKGYRLSLGGYRLSGSFPFVPPPPPSLVGAYYLQPPDARAIFLHNDLLCNDTCSVTGGA